ncbi:hypothetical protein GCM10022244_11450 [Streptomyces gulbargensis]|uniref:CsbD-like domain-containing protein n=1 Tax=Streptomyces gulbargensis TaxID=364901 RepID=A0ABP7LKW9_9ACTN
MGKGAMDKGKGKIKETVGKATGNEKMQAEGKTDQMKGKAREGIEKVHRGGMKARDEMKRRTS